MYQVYSNELYHHGIKGQKWGVRRFQNEDGSLTAAGQKRYNKMDAYRNKKATAAKSMSERKDRESKEASAAVRDLKKNGSNSATYLKWKMSEQDQRATDYEWETGESYHSSTARMLDDVFDRIGRNTQVQELIKQNTEAAKKAKQESENWMRAHQQLMDMPITVYTKKSDIRRTRSNAMANRG